jgi:nucleotide-binding universal stress UspA family protein
MAGIQKILHPTDFSECSRHAFQMACALARDNHATLIVLHVMMPSVSPVQEVPPPDPFRPAESQGSAGSLPWPKSSDPRIRVEHRLTEGDPADEILRLTDALRCDLIVMGTHGRTGLGRLLLGSVAEEVLRRAVCPVLTVKMPLRAASVAPLETITSGGQTGAERAAWRTARAFGIQTGGWMPRGFLTEDGPHPEFADEYGAAEMPTDSEPARTEKNIQDSDATLWFGQTTTWSAQATVGASHLSGKPCLPIYPGASFEPSQVASWITENRIRTLNVAGNREGDEHGIGDRVERFLGEVLQQLGHQRA